MLSCNRLRPGRFLQRWKLPEKIDRARDDGACIVAAAALGMKCRSYEATAAPTADPAGLRERLRAALIGGPGAVRSPVSEVNP